MHFIEVSKTGQSLPTSLPPQFMPPSMRKVEPQQQQLLKQQQQQQQQQRVIAQKPPTPTARPATPNTPSPPLKPPQPNLVHHTPPTQPKQAFNIKIKPITNEPTTQIPPKIPQKVTFQVSGWQFFVIIIFLITCFLLFLL